MNPKGIIENTSEGLTLINKLDERFRHRFKFKWLDGQYEVEVCGVVIL